MYLTPSRIFLSYPSRAASQRKYKQRERENMPYSSGFRYLHGNTPPSTHQANNEFFITSDRFLSRKLLGLR
jgi:hypothetical protein